MYYLIAWYNNRYVLIVTGWNGVNSSCTIQEVITTTSEGHRRGKMVFGIAPFEILDQDVNLEELKGRVAINLL